MKLISEFNNSLLKRKEIVATLESVGNPGFDGSRKAVSQSSKTSEDLVVIKKVESHFGRGNFTIEAFIYDSVEDKDKTEPKKKEKKK